MSPSCWFTNIVIKNPPSTDDNNMVVYLKHYCYFFPTEKYIYIFHLNRYHFQLSCMSVTHDLVNRRTRRNVEYLKFDINTTFEVVSPPRFL